MKSFMTEDGKYKSKAPEYDSKIYEFLSDDIHYKLREFLFSN